MQDLVARQAADARLYLFAGLGGRIFSMVAVALTMTLVTAVMMTAVLKTGTPDKLALPIDFKVFWAAGQIVLDGEPMAALDQARLAAAHATDVDTRMPWLYPPGYLLLMAPFGALGFAQALILSTVLSLLAVALALRPFVGGVTPLWVALIFAPAFLPTLAIGQNSLFWMAGLLAALAGLRSGRWVLAGVCIGCLTLKPQLGLMIPVALLAIGAWRTILAATVTALLVAALPTLVTGPAYWPLLAQGIAEQGRVMLATIADLPLMVGPFSLLAAWGVEPALALRLQWGVTALSALAVFLLWRSDRIGFDAKAAGLLAATLLASVYLWYYEAALMAAIGLFLLRAGILDGRPLSLALFGLLWLGGGLLTINVLAKLVDPALLGAVLLTPVLLASLALCLLHLATARRSPSVPA